MCGIVGYVGYRDALGVVVDALRRMEYRGYDSAGVAILDGSGSLAVERKAGRLANLEAELDQTGLAAYAGATGMGHTRWATHGAPTDRNAHPHRDVTGKVAVVHNGIIENFAPLRKELEDAGVELNSDTDTEVTVHLVARAYADGPTAGDFVSSALSVLRRLEGAFTLVFAHADHPGEIIAARRSTPLVVGVGQGEMFVASDVTAFIEHTREAVELGQDQVVVITANGYSVTDFAEFRTLLDGLVDPAADWHADLTIALPDDQRRVRAAANATDRDLGGPRTLHEAFFEHAARHPGRPALRWRPGSDPATVGTGLTYGELADRALAIGGALAAAGVRPGDTVAVLVPKGHRQIPAVLGVLAAGATYLPISTEQPPARRDRILARGGARVALTDTAIDLPDGVTALPLAEAVAGPRLDAAHVPPTDAIAYVLFTSGSTGEPKGVEVGHRAATNTIDGIVAHFGLGADDHTIGLSALEFDLSVFDIFAPLSLGGAVVAVDAGIDRDATAWAELIAETGVTVVNCAPGLIGMLLDTATAEQLRSVRVVITGGDRVHSGLGHRFRELVAGVRFAGLGGTTETAIHSTVCEVTDMWPADRTSVPYGTPLPNVRCRVVNSRGEDCPDWVPGELWIGGVSVAAGYRGDPDRTADRFVTVDGIAWYRTGDLARYLPDGTLDFLGRADHQVKIRGFRVELGEIEAALSAQPGIREAVATVTDSGRLAAVAAGEAPSAEAVLAGLRELLPAHMIPELFELVSAIPLTGNGKLDRGAVARMVTDDSARDSYVASATALEAAVEYIAAQVLGIEQLGATTDFFDVGGNSILATTLTAKLRGLLGVERFGVTGVLEGRTVRGICAVLTAGESDPDRLDQVARILLELAEVALPEAVTA